MLVDGLYFGQLGSVVPLAMPISTQWFEKTKDFQEYFQEFCFVLADSFQFKSSHDDVDFILPKRKLGFIDSSDPALDDLVIIFFKLFLLSRTAQSRWPCQWLSRWSFDFSVLRALQSSWTSAWRHMWAFWQSIRRLRTRWYDQQEGEDNKKKHCF